MDRVLKAQKDIVDFLKLENEFDARNFNATDYNSFITMKGIAGWEYRPFHVYHGKGVDDENLIVDGLIKIASEKDYPVKTGIVEYDHPFSEKTVYKIKVSEIEKIELKDRENN